MLEQIMNSTNFYYLPRAMTAASMRQEVVAHNIANINTPNYVKKNLEFEEMLAQEIYGETKPKGKVQLVQTNDKHLPFRKLNAYATPAFVEDRSAIMRVDHNNVDIDIEMATLAKNQIYYNAMATQLGGYVSKLRNAITSGGQS